MRIFLLLAAAVILNGCEKPFPDYYPVSKNVTVINKTDDTGRYGHRFYYLDVLTTNRVSVTKSTYEFYSSGDKFILP